MYDDKDKAIEYVRSIGRMFKVVNECKNSIARANSEEQRINFLNKVNSRPRKNK